MPAESAIELQGTLSQADIVRFQYYQMFRAGWRVLLGLVIIVVVMLGYLLGNAISSPDYPASLWSLLGPSVALLAFLGTIGVMPHRNARKLFGSQQYFREPVSFTFTHE